MIMTFAIMVVILITFAFVDVRKTRIGLFSAYIFLQVCQLGIILQFASMYNLRLGLVIILCLLDAKRIWNTIAISLHTSRAFILYIIFLLYLILSALMGGAASNSVFIMVGNMVFAVLIIHYTIRYRKAKQIIFIPIVIANVLHIIGYFMEFYSGQAGILLVLGANHQVAGQSAGIIIAIFLGLKVKKVKTIYPIVILSIAVLLSGARTAVAGIFVLLVRGKRYAVIAVLLGLALITISSNNYKKAQTILHESTLERYSILLGVTSKSNTMNAPLEVAFRKENIEIALQMFGDNPVYGIGYGGWIRARSTYGEIVGYDLTIHNSYLLILCELGIIGVILFLLMYGMAFYECRTTSSQNHQWQKEIALNMYIIALVNSFGHSHMLINRLTFITIALLIANNISTTKQRAEYNGLGKLYS